MFELIYLLLLGLILFNFAYFGPKNGMFKEFYYFFTSTLASLAAIHNHVKIAEFIRLYYSPQNNIPEALGLLLIFLLAQIIFVSLGNSYFEKIRTIKFLEPVSKVFSTIYGFLKGVTLFSFILLVMYKLPLPLDLREPLEPTAKTQFVRKILLFVPNLYNWCIKKFGLNLPEFLI